jgi:sugar phosphate isomerase/epimerase
MQPARDIVAFQLYSAHSRPATEDILAMVAAAGYRAVETYGPWHDDPASTRELAGRHGLAIPSLHLDLDELRRGIDPAVALAAMLGARLIVVPWLAPQERPATASAWRALAVELDAMALALRGKGLALAWHNHDFEFAALPDGALPMAVLLEAAPALLWQMDVGWVTRAGENPLAWIERQAPRIACLHVKDVARPEAAHREDGWTDVGRGTVDWPDIVAKSRAVGIRHFIIEHDAPGDVVAFAKASLDYFKKL